MEPSSSGSAGGTRSSRAGPDRPAHAREAHALLDLGLRRLSALPLGAGLALVSGIALVARLRQSALDVAMFNDGPRFVAMAEAFGRGAPGALFSDPFHPLTSALMAGVAAVSGLELEAAGRAISVAAGVTACAVAFALARAQFGPALGLVTGLLFAVHPRLVDNSSSVQSDGLHLMWVLLGAWALWRALERGAAGRLRAALVAAAGAGLACGLAYLTRPEGLIVAVVAAVWLAADVLAGRLAPLRSVALGAAFGAAVLVVAAPYVIALRDHSGAWQLTQKKSAAEIVAAVGSLAPRTPAPPGEAGVGEETLARSGVAERVQSAGSALVEVVHDGTRSLNKVFLGLAILGFRRGRPGRATRYALTYVGILFATLLGLHLSAGYVSRRHWLVGAALLLPFAARGLVALSGWAGALAARLPPLRDPSVRAWPRLRPLWVPACVAVAVIGLYAYFGERQESPVKVARKQAAVWLSRTAPQRVVAGRRERIGFYADAARFVGLPDGEARDVLERVRAQGAEFLVVEEHRLGGLAPEALGGVRPLHRVAYPGGAVLVLALEPAPPSVSAGEP